jgi:phosphonate transport system substrate-binding protein
LRFALPPSLGTADALARARGFGDHLGQRMGMAVSMLVAPDYATLQSMVIDGVVDAAWAPPFVCARLELKGLRIAARGSRDGASSYRAALVCRRDHPLELTGESLMGARAAWVDRDSVGGYLLAAALLKSKGIDLGGVLRTQRFVGSYRDALKAVADARADVTSIFAAPQGSYEAGVGEVLPGATGEFGLIAYTRETPNDGVVLSGKAGRDVGVAIASALLELHTSDEGLAVLKRAFRVDRFDAAPAGGYRSLYRLALVAPA